MDISTGQIIAWVVLGALVGPLIGRMVKRNKKGYGLTGNLVIGLVGAVVGGLIFNALDVGIGRDIELTLNDFIAAFVGSLIFLFVVNLVKRG